MSEFSEICLNLGPKSSSFFAHEKKKHNLNCLALIHDVVNMRNGSILKMEKTKICIKQVVVVKDILDVMLLRKQETAARGY